MEEVDGNYNKMSFKLYIPTNVKTRLEFFKGFGIKELTASVIILLTLLPISFFIYKIKGDYLIPVLIEFIGVAITVISITKDENNLCVIDQIRYMLEFIKMQKKYEYRYFDKWR